MPTLPYDMHMFRNSTNCAEITIESWHISGKQACRLIYHSLFVLSMILCALLYQTFEQMLL